MRSEEKSLQEALSRRDQKIEDLEAKLDREKRYSDRLKAERNEAQDKAASTTASKDALEEERRAAKEREEDLKKTVAELAATLKDVKKIKNAERFERDKTGCFVVD